MPLADFLLHDTTGLVGCPVALYTEILKILMPLHRLGEPLVALLGRRTAHRGGNLQDMGLTTCCRELPCKTERITAHLQASLHIITTDKRRIILILSFPVEIDHRDTLFTHPADSSRDRCRLIGGHHQQVYSRGCQTVYLLDLFLRVVIRMGDDHLCRLLIQVLCGKHLTVYLVTPPPFRALRNTYLISFFLLSARNEGQISRQEDYD